MKCDACTPERMCVSCALDRILSDIDDDECEDDDYDDSADHDECPDCKGSGWYTGFREVKHCPTCDGSGWL